FPVHTVRGGGPVRGRLLPVVDRLRCGFRRAAAGRRVRCGEGAGGDDGGAGAVSRRRAPAAGAPGPARRAAGAAVCLLAACLTLAGCSRTVSGDAAAGGAGEGAAAQEYARLLEECAVVPEGAIAQTTGVRVLVKTFSGAVCRWRSPDGATDVQLNWFESGTLDREKSVAERLGYSAESV